MTHFSLRRHWATACTSNCCSPSRRSVSPLQRALVARFVKDGLGAMTLAIGDSANDMSTIQATDVGIGISGKDGPQTVDPSDYAIAQVSIRPWFAVLDSECVADTLSVPFLEESCCSSMATDRTDEMVVCRSHRFSQVVAE